MADFSKKKKALVLVMAVSAIMVEAIILIRKPETGPPQTISENTVLNFTQKTADISSFGLEISKLNIRAPIIPDVDDGNEAEYLKAIENGVALSKKYAANPQETGNMFIFGHSKYYRDKPGSYKEVFKELNQLKKGDKFKIIQDKITYNYEVTQSKLVEAGDFSILDPTPSIKDDKTLTLMTCWPPGTLDRRWAVIAQQS